MDTSANSNALAAEQSIRRYSTYIYIIAGIQVIIPIILGMPANSLLGAFLAVLGYGVRRGNKSACIIVIVVGGINVCMLALSGAYGSTVLSVVLIACGLKSLKAIQVMHSLEYIANIEEGLSDRSSVSADRGCTVNPIPKEHNVSKAQRRILVVISGIVAMGVIIALGASSNQGGLLGAAIIVVFWGWGGKAKETD